MRLAEDGSVYSTPHSVGDALDGGNVLPGFTLRVSDIFPDELA